MPIRLDQRLTKIASLVDYGAVADMGCDHGKLSYYLIGTDRASKVIATDISAPSLAKAKELARENGVGERMLTRLGDGLCPVESNEVDTVIIAGLGGDVIAGILQDARKDGKTFSHFILSPNTHPEKVRREIVKSGHTIVVDEMLECLGKTYTVIKTNVGKSTLDENQVKYGAFYKDSDNFLSFANQEIKKLEYILSHNEKAVDIKTKLEELKNVLKERN